jgi:hypothetical protein
LKVGIEWRGIGAQVKRQTLGEKAVGMSSSGQNTTDDASAQADARFTFVSSIGLFLSVPFLIAQAALVAVQLSPPPPPLPPSAGAASVSVALTIAVLLADIAVFGLMYRLAKGGRTGLVFVPPLFYAAVVVGLLYLPVLLRPAGID